MEIKAPATAVMSGDRRALARIRTGPAPAKRMAARANDIAPGRLSPSSAALPAVTRTKGGAS